MNGFAPDEAGVETEGFDEEFSFRVATSLSGVGDGVGETDDDVVVWAKEFRRQKSIIKITAGIFFMKPLL